MIRISPLLACALSISLLACGDDDKGGGEPDCTISTLTYENFGSMFMATYCQGCHSTSSSDRHGAPVAVNFDTLPQVQEKSSAIDERAGRSNSMPPVFAPAFPSASERSMLSEWIFCGTN